jgi:hypothetical protein
MAVSIVPSGNDVGIVAYLQGRGAATPATHANPLEAARRLRPAARTDLHGVSMPRHIAACSVPGTVGAGPLN